MLYQAQHSVIADEVTLEGGYNLNFPVHIHNSFEIIIAPEGEMEVFVGEKSYTISGNECVFVLPNQLHEIKTKKYAKHSILIFSPQLVKTYAKKIEALVPRSNSFFLDSFYIDKIINLNKKRTTAELKGLLYSICGEFDKNADYIESKKDKQNLLLKIFNFVAENYKRDCSLYELARQTTYNYEYLSKLFSKSVGMSYTEYVCRFRINESCYLLKNTSNTVLDIAFECGFDCLRSFNRNFKAIMKITPTQYRYQKTE